MEEDGVMAQLKKKERLMKSREREKLEKILMGISKMARLPGALFVVDINREHIAVNEARKLGIPIIALVDTNCNPDLVQFPIPSNDDALKSIELIASVIASAIQEGSKSRDLQLLADAEEKKKRKQEADSKASKKKASAEAEKKAAAAKAEEAEDEAPTES